MTTPEWPVVANPAGKLHVPITEDWLRQNGWRIEDGRNDDRLPVRRLALKWYTVEGRTFCSSPDDLCIDISPAIARWKDQHEPQWHCWIMQVEPYRHIHVRTMRYTWELIRLWEGLTGMVWPGTYGNENAGREGG